jgi:hypothetical protein
MTQVVKINLLEIVDAAQAIQDACDVREAAGLGLRGCFESGGELILIFQGDLKTGG